MKGAAAYCRSQRRYGELFIFLMDAAARYAGFFLGKHYKCLPEKVVLGCTLQPAYWAKKKQKSVEHGSKEKDAAEDAARGYDASVLEELHALELGAFKAFIKLCNTYGLRYYAIGGTLLGAVRHKGFIPWDDDVDVAMPRSDYERLIALLQSGAANEVLGEEYRLECWQTDDTFKSYFAKICSAKYELQEELLEDATVRKGYLIDILPIDGTPDEENARKLYYAKAMGLRFLCGTANVHTGIRTSRPKWEQMILRVVRALRLYRLIDIKRVYRQMDRLFLAQNADTAKYAGTLTGAYKTKEIVPRKYFGDTYEEYSLWEFEGMMIRGPKDCDAYLTHMFGDYQKLPAPEERKVHYKPCMKPIAPEEK